MLIYDQRLSLCSLSLGGEISSPRRHEREGLTAVLPIVLKVAIHRPHTRAGMKFREADETGVGQRHGLRTVAAQEVAHGPLFALQVDAFHFPLKGWWLVASLVVVADRLLADGALVRRSPSRPEGAALERP